MAPTIQCSGTSRVILISGMAIVLKTYDDIETASQEAAERVFERIRENPSLALCAATGASPSEVYRKLALRLNQEAVPLDEITLVKLDEWGGLDADDPASCEVYLKQSLVQPLGLRPDQFIGFAGDSDEAVKECARIETRLETLGHIDLSILGVGVNGHLGFNEPGPELTAGCHVASLAESTLGHSMLENSKGHPSFGMTLGMANILSSKEIIVLIFGAEKARVLRRLLEEGIATEFPASFLQLHPRVLCYCDRPALMELSDAREV